MTTYLNFNDKYGVSIVGPIPLGYKQQVLIKFLILHSLIIYILKF